MGQVTLAEGPALSEVEGIADLTVAAVFEQYRDRIYRYILRLVRDPAEADDLTQETFLRVYRQLETLQDPAALTTWLYRIATHVCYDRFRQSSYRFPPQSLDDAATDDAEPLEAQLDNADAPRLDQVIEQREMRVCVQEFLEQLPDDYRMTILLHDLHGLTNPEIARMLGCSLATVKIRLHRARRRFKAACQAGCDLSSNESGMFVCERKPPDPSARLRASH